jgi:hypothetical protein
VPPAPALVCFFEMTAFPHLRLYQPLMAVWHVVLGILPLLPYRNILTELTGQN